MATLRRLRARLLPPRRTRRRPNPLLAAAPPFLLAIDTVFFEQRPFSLPAVPTDSLPAEPPGQLLVVSGRAILAALNVPLALVALLPVPSLAAFTYVFVKSIQPKYATMRVSVGTLNARLERGARVEFDESTAAESGEM